MEKQFNSIYADNVDHFDGSTNPTISVPKVIQSDVLFSGQRELIIQHMGQRYRLRRTQLEKLILTK